MVCKVFSKYEETCLFVTGSTNFKVESLNYHAESASHKRHVSKDYNKMAAPGTTIEEKTLVSLNQSEHKRMSRLFRSAHALAKHGRPYSDFSWQCKLDKAKGLDIGNTYLNDEQAASFVHYIAEAERKNTFADMAQSSL